MRILKVVHHYLDPNAGAPGATLALAAALRRRGHDVELLSFDDLPSALPEKAAAPAFPGFVAARLRSARRRYDVIDATGGDTWLFSRLSRRPPSTVVRTHGLEHTASQQLLSDVARGEAQVSWRYRFYWGGIRLREVEASLRSADATIFLSEADRSYAVSELRLDGGRSHVLPNGLDEALLGIPVDLEVRPAGDLRVAYLGGPLVRKGWRYGVEAMHEAMAARPNMRLTLAGIDRPRADALRDFATNLHDRIDVIERYERSDLARLLQGHQVHLFPTLFEGFALASLEAMACGLTPVTSNIPSVRQVVDDHVNGLLIEPRDPRAFAAAVLALADDPALTARLRSAAHAKAQRYTWDMVAERTEQVYEAAAAR